MLRNNENGTKKFAAPTLLHSARDDGREKSLEDKSRPEDFDIFSTILLTSFDLFIQNVPSIRLRPPSPHIIEHLWSTA
jgi:hypothetical protein